MDDPSQPAVTVPPGWATTEGDVLDKSLETIHYTAGGERITYYEPVVRYAYHVGGERYENSRVTPQVMRFKNRRMAESFLTAYHVGEPVTVIYNPANPHEAYLAESAALLSFSRRMVYVVVGVLVLIVLLVVLLIALL